MHNCLKNDAGVTVGHLPQNITFYKNNTDFNIANWAKCDIKILMIKTHYTVSIDWWGIEIFTDILRISG